MRQRERKRETARKMDRWMNGCPKTDGKKGSHIGLQPSHRNRGKKELTQ